MDDSQTSRLAFASASFLTVLTWYALPDAVRSRPARAVIKAGLLGVTAVGMTKVPEVFPSAMTRPPEPRVDMPPAALVGIGLGSAALGTAATIWAEKAIFAYGERQRAAGVRCAHTPAALAFALISGAAAAVDWDKISAQLIARAGVSDSRA